MSDRIKEIVQSKAQRFNFPCEQTIKSQRIVPIPYLTAKLEQNRQEMATLRWQ